MSKSEEKAMKEFMARYRQMSVNGTTMYCASMAPTGTRMQRQVCMNAQEYAEAREKSLELMRRLQNAPVVPVPPENMCCKPRG